MQKLLTATLVSAAFMSAPALAETDDLRSENAVQQHKISQASFEKLNLTAEQKASMKSIRDSRREEMKQVWQEWRKAENSLIQAERFDESRAKALLERDYRMMKEKEKLILLKARHATYNILTPEQKSQLRTMKEDVLDKMEP